jgi:hypothetical protein
MLLMLLLSQEQTFVCTIGYWLPNILFVLFPEKVTCSTQLSMGKFAYGPGKDVQPGTLSRVHPALCNNFSPFYCHNGVLSEHNCGGGGIREPTLFRIAYDGKMFLVQANFMVMHDPKAFIVDNQSYDLTVL